MSNSTQGGIGNGSAVILVRRVGFPLFAGVGLGAWRASDDGDRLHGGHAYVGGLTLSSRHHIAIEGRFSDPSTAMGIVTSTMSVGIFAVKEATRLMDEA